MTSCSVDGCTKPHYAKGLCNTHWQRLKRHGDPLVEYKRTAPRPPKQTCSILGCAELALARGWCSTHWQRWKKHGDPTYDRAGAGTPRHARIFLEQVVMPYCGEQCLVWPYARSTKGYALIGDGAGGIEAVHAIVCTRLHGPRPTPQHQAAHACGKGHLACVTPAHVSWKTPSANQMDRVEHGTSNRGIRHANAVLTDALVIEIRKASGGHRAIARRFGVSQRTVSDIKTRRSWAWLD